MGVRETLLAVNWENSHFLHVYIGKTKIKGMMVERVNVIETASVTVIRLSVRQANRVKTPQRQDTTTLVASTR